MEIPLALTSTPNTHTPLANLKYHYQSTSRPSSVQGSASTALPLISTPRSKYRALSSQSHEYTRTINETLRMKLKLGQIHDQISAIDMKMRKENVKHRKAVDKHEHFENSFEQFLSKQYDRVKEKLLELEAHETESYQMKRNLADLRRTITLKSLRIYELERTWRQHKMCQLFLCHIAGLLKNSNSATVPTTATTAVASNGDNIAAAVATETGTSSKDGANDEADVAITGNSTDDGANDEAAAVSTVTSNSDGINNPAAAVVPNSDGAIDPSTATVTLAFNGSSVAAASVATVPVASATTIKTTPIQPNFNVDPICATPTLDDLISNHELHDCQDELFEEQSYVHVTPARVEDFLVKLKRQNIRLLRHKLEHEKIKNVLKEAGEVCSADTQSQATALALQVDEVQRKLEAQNNEVWMAEQSLDEVFLRGRALNGADVEASKRFIEKLYEQIFKPTYEERSHVHMAKCVEEYVQSLLCQLYSYEPQILKKVLKRY